MNAFIAAIIVLIVLAFTFTNLPGDLARRVQDSADVNGFIKTYIVGPLAKNFTGGKSPEETRLELIDKIQGSIGALENQLQESQPSKDGTGQIATSTENTKKSPSELANEAQDLLEELKSHNADEGFLRDTADKIISKVLPSSSQCVK